MSAFHFYPLRVSFVWIEKGTKRGGRWSLSPFNTLKTPPLGHCHGRRGPFIIRLLSIEQKNLFLFTPALRSASMSAVRHPPPTRWEGVSGAWTLSERACRGGHKFIINIPGCLWLSVIIPFSLTCVSLKKEPKSDGTPPLHMWVIDPLAQVISFSPHTQPTLSLISSYLSPGMQTPYFEKYLVM